MSRVLRIRSSSNATANVDDIILRETITTRLVFRPTIVDNKKNQDASVRGIFVYQRKAPNDSWEDHNELTLSNLKASGD